MNAQKFHRGTSKPRRVRPKRWHQCLPIIGVVALVAVLIWTASKYHGFVNLGYEIIELRDKNQTLKVEQDKLRAQLARLQRPDRVMRDILVMGLQRMPPAMRFSVYIDEDPSMRPSEPSSVDQQEILVAFSDNEP